MIIFLATWYSLHTTIYIGHIIQSLVLRKLVFIFYQNTHNEYINIASALRIYNLLKVRVLRVNNP